MKHNVFKIGSPVHASFIDEKSPLCLSYNPGGYLHTDSKINCPECLSKIEGELTNHFADFSPMERNILEFIETKYKLRNLSYDERRLSHRSRQDK